MAEVAPKIKMKDGESAKKWLIKKNIPIYQLGKKDVVYQIDVDCELDKPFVINLKRKFPNNWEQTYKRLNPDEVVCNMVIMQLQGEISMPSNRVLPLNNADLQLLNSLTK